MNYQLRYKPGTTNGARFPHLRYPRNATTRERCEQMREAMPDPDAFEIVDEDQP